MSRPGPSTSGPPGPAGPSRPLGQPAKPPAVQPGGAAPAQIPRRSAGALPGIARTASSLRQSPLNPSGSSLPAHLRNFNRNAPRVPSPLGKGTPARNTKQSLPVRTSKTTERHVFLPEDPQLAPLPKSPMGSQVNLAGPPRRDSAQRDRRDSRGMYFGAPQHHDERSDAEKMTKREREEAKLPRLTAYTTAEGYRLKLLQAFLKREHGVGVVRVFDDCVYAVYNLPLLPGYGASTQIRSSPAVKSPGGVSLLERMTQAEDLGYNDSYFPQAEEPEHISHNNPSEYILSHSPPSQISPVNIMSSMDVPAGMEGEREAVIEERQEQLEAGDGLHDAIDLRSEEDVGVKVALERRLSQSEQSAAEAGIVLGTHLSPEHPGFLEHTPAPALSPDDLKDHTEEYSSSTHPTYHIESPEPTIPAPRDPPRVSYATLERRQPTIAQPPKSNLRRRKSYSTSGQIAEAVFFSYGVSVFFGFQESEERMIMEDCDGAGTWMRGAQEDDWEVEEFHYVYPRIYNDMFTFKSHSHLFKLSLSHAIAQSTKLSIYESTMQESLSLTSSFPKELSTTGHLQLGRRDALRMTGRLFKLRMDVNLIGGILGTSSASRKLMADTPELFWSEASLYPLYEAIREYLEIGPRVQVLNDRLSVAGDLLEIIHEYIEERGTHRITWIIIWLIIIACLVEVGEVVARVVFHNLPREEGEFLLWKGGKYAFQTVLG